MEVKILLCLHSVLICSDDFHLTNSETIFHVLKLMFSLSEEGKLHLFRRHSVPLTTETLIKDLHYNKGITLLLFIWHSSNIKTNYDRIGYTALVLSVVWFVQEVKSFPKLITHVFLNLYSSRHSTLYSPSKCFDINWNIL
jgi:hypothetical protein